MRIYILHETHSDCSLNDHEVFVDAVPANKIFTLMRDKFLNDSENMNMPKPVEIHHDEDGDLYFTDSTGESIRIYITEHTI
jgi:hypothetical protein